MTFPTRCLLRSLVVLLLLTVLVLPASADDSATKNSNEVTRQVDQLIDEELADAGAEVATVISAEDFLRRVSLDLTGKLPSPNEVTLFGLDADPLKRNKTIDRLIESPEFAANWSRYWRDVIFSRATDPRSQRMRGVFEKWMTQQINSNRPWDKITTEIITATGEIQKAGNTALVVAHQGLPEEIAAETSRIFLGIQIQCANCHDHPSDGWRREQFHQLAAFFPRVRVQRVKDSMPRRFEVVSFNRPDGANGGNRFGQFRQNPEKLLRQLDANDDGKLTKDEVKGRKQLNRVFNRLLKLGDTDQDKALSVAELKKLPPPNFNRRRSSEYYMPNLDVPTDKGTRIDPAFFVAGQTPEAGLPDLDRRGALAGYITDVKNPWFAKAFVNRIWAELLGEGFTMPVDDMGPERTVAFPEVLEALSEGFVENNYDMKWLFRTITNTEAYQRKIRPVDPSVGRELFAAAIPMRLRADQLYNALARVLQIAEPAGAGQTGKGYRGPRGPRAQFAELFGFDPSTPQADLTGTVPQALFLMNSTVITNRVRAAGDTPLDKLVKKFSNDEDALAELYLRVLSREPSQSELKICSEHIAASEKREEAYEDILWSLLNSTEFRTKR